LGPNTQAADGALPLLCQARASRLEDAWPRLRAV